MTPAVSRPKISFGGFAGPREKGVSFNTIERLKNSIDHGARLTSKTDLIKAAIAREGPYSRLSQQCRRHESEGGLLNRSPKNNCQCEGWTRGAMTPPVSHQRSSVTGFTGASRGAKCHRTERSIREWPHTP